jgi:hypothetical protein
VLLHVGHLNPFLMTLIKRQAPLVALTTSLFKEIPVHAIGMLKTLRIVRLNEGTISNDIAAISVQDDLKELEINTMYLLVVSRHLAYYSLRKFAPIAALHQELWQRSRRASVPQRILGVVTHER